ncbi:MAG: PEGA domain-containing protein, partial [bacterium]
MYRNFVLLSLFVLTFTGKAWAQPGYYRVTAQPGGIKVYINEARADTAGMLSPGTYELRIEKEGYEGTTRNIRIESDRVTEIRVRLMPVRMRIRSFPKRYDFRLRRSTASLILSSNPPGLPIALNNDEKGTTPLRLDDVPTGPYRVKIGAVSDSITLRQDDLRRLRLEKGRINEVTKAIFDSNYERVRLRTLTVFMEDNEARAQDCSLFRERRGSSVFRLANSNMFLVARMIFQNTGDATISVPLRFSIYQGSNLLSRASHTVNITP